METSVRYYHPSYIDCSVLQGTRDPRALQMSAAAAAVAAGAYYCHSGGYLYRDTVGSNPTRYDLGTIAVSSAEDLDNATRLVKDATGRPSRNSYGSKARSSADGSTPDSVRMRDVQSPYSYTKTTLLGDWMDRDGLELEGRKMLKQGVVEGEDFSARNMPEKNGAGGEEAERDDRSGMEQKPVLRFPWMKTTKSHAHQWKAQWIGKHSLREKLSC